MCLDGHPLSSSTLLPPWDPLLLHLRFHSISPGFILWTIGLWVGEAPNVLLPGNIAVVFKGRHFFETETNRSGCHSISDRGGGWLMDQKEGAC